MIVISQILSLWGNSATNATVEGQEHTQVSCTYPGQLLTVLQNSVAKKHPSSQPCSVQLLSLQLGNVTLSLTLSPE